MYKKIAVLIIILLSGFAALNAKNADSLELKLKSLTDTSKANVLLQLADYYLDIDSAKCWKYLNELNDFSVKYNQSHYKAKYHQTVGIFFKKRGNLNEAIEAFQEAAKILKEENKLNELGGIYNNIGATYTDKGEYQISVEYLIKALRIYDYEKNDYLKAKLLLNIGLVFYYQKNYKLALDYYYQSLKLREKINDKRGTALIYNNLGIVYFFTKDADAAIGNFKKALKISTQLNDTRAMSMPIFNIAEIYSEHHQYDSALVYYNKSYSIDTFLKDKASSTISLTKLALCYCSIKKFTKALNYALLAEKQAIEVDSKEDIKDIYQVLADIYIETKDYSNALKYSELCSSIKDSLYSKQSTEMVAELQTRYETEKKDLQLSKQKETIRNQKLVSRILFSGILLAFGFIALVLIQFIQKKRAYKILEEQKKNITDSINYASRIQSAMLPPETLLNNLLPGYFVLYMPRDIVSGDFYWITIANERTIVAVADCTGHGVPGAFMSMLGFAFLNEIVSKSPDIPANEILNELRLKVKSSLHQNEHSASKDGMDIALAIIDPARKNLQFAGANNPLLLCRNESIINLAPDKMPIGIHSIEKNSFSLKEIELQKGDTVYMFSDGYSDQFGGEKMKKLGKNNFEKLLLESSKLNIKAQKYYLEEKILEWMTDRDQMDDILVMGISIS
jgi:serine phosphatase RsbU (regulator of sigma subunit)/Tfp pilus assembly protein PilF